MKPIASLLIALALWGILILLPVPVIKFISAFCTGWIIGKIAYKIAGLMVKK